MKKFKLPTLIGIALLLVGVIAGVFLIQQTQVFKLGADVTATPKNVRITNITDDSLSISWTTDKATSGFVKWGKSTSSLPNVDLDEFSENGLTHYVTLRGLTQSTDYFLAIVSNGEEFTNNGTPWTTTTGISLPTPTNSEIVTGTVLTQDGTPAKNALIYISIGGASTLSTTTSPSGSWIVPIATIRTTDLSNYFNPEPQSDILEISVQAENGVASAQAYIASANPLPPIVVGQVHDFKNVTQSQTTGLPNADLTVPESSQSSYFNVGDIATTLTDVVTLDSLESGEVVTSSQPEFFGKAPPTTDLVITIESDPVTETVTSSSAGNWNWSPPADLEPGTHTITITWRDINGVLNSISRTFIVQAAEGPAFAATPSATPTTTPSPTPTQSPTASATPKPSGTPTATPKATLKASPTATSSATPVPLPDSGTLTPTILLFSMGIVLLLIGVFAGLPFAKKHA